MQDIADNPPTDPAEQGAAYARQPGAERQAREARGAHRRPHEVPARGHAHRRMHRHPQGRAGGRDHGPRAPGGRAGEAEEDRGRRRPTRRPMLPRTPPTPTARSPRTTRRSPRTAADEPAAPAPSFDERFEQPWTTRTTRNHQSPEAKHAKAAGLSTAVIDDLAAIRTGIVRAALAKRFDLGVRPRGVPPRDGHLDARHGAPGRHPPRPHEPAPDGPHGARTTSPPRTPARGSTTRPTAPG